MIRVWQPEHSEIDKISPFEVGTQRQPNTVPSFCACPPSLGEFLGRANLGDEFRVARAEAGNVHLFERTPSGLDPFGLGARSGAINGSGFLLWSICQ